jgi:hypothetical protein
MQLKLFDIRPPFERERRVLAARPATVRFSRKQMDIAHAKHPAPSVQLSDSIPPVSNSENRGSTSSEEFQEQLLADLFAARLLARKDQGMYGEDHPFAEQLRRAKEV